MAELDHEHIQTRAAATAALQLSMTMLAALRRTGAIDAQTASAITDAAITSLEQQRDEQSALARRLLETVAQVVAEAGRQP